MLASILRTIVPSLWASFINWALIVVPLLEPHREELLAYGLPLAAVATALLTAAWYAFWRWLEPKLPNWLKRAVLGSAKAPIYAGKHVATTNGNIIIEENGQAVYDSLERPKE